MNKIIKYLSPAKINLYFDIVGQRKDGYHLVKTLMHTVSLYDEIYFKLTKTCGIELKCSSNIPNHTNLVYRAAKILADYSKTSYGVKIKIVKHIPIGAGLGGGSSNAATTLIALNKLWKLGYGTKTLTNLGAKLGADVPFFIKTGFALVTGIGEKIKCFQSGLNLWIMLIYPRILSLTKLAYTDYDKFCKNKLTKYVKKNKIIFNLQKGVQEKDVKFVLYNCLEPIVFKRYPEIELVKNMLSSRGLTTATMSGSGSAVYAILPSKSFGVRLQQYFNKSNPNWNVWVVKTISGLRSRPKDAC